MVNDDLQPSPTASRFDITHLQISLSVKELRISIRNSFRDTCKFVTGVSNFVSDIVKVITDVRNKMHQLHLLKISVIEFPISEIKLQISANILRHLERLADISNKIHIFVFI